MISVRADFIRFCQGQSESLPRTSDAQVCKHPIGCDLSRVQGPNSHRESLVQGDKLGLYLSAVYDPQSLDVQIDHGIEIENSECDVS